MARLFIWYVTSFPGIFFFLAYMKGNPKQESVPIETQILYTDKCWIKRMYY